MATIKSYTDLQQSKKLAEILPLESADIWYSYYGNSKYNTTIAYKGQQWFLCQIRNSLHDDIPCWSLAALLGILTENKICHYEDRYYCQYISEGDEFPIYSTAEYDNPIDACYEMILKLNELKML